MLFSYILLHVSSFMDDLPVGLLLCIVPFILGWLAAFAYYKVTALREQIAELNTKVSDQSKELTDLRMKLAQTESESETRAEQLRKVRNDLIMCESERNALREQVNNAGGTGAGIAKVAKAAAAATIMFAGTKYKTDDLKIVEGIGPKIAELLNNAGIQTWRQLADSAIERLREILDAAGSAYQIHDPGTWPQQADLADRGEWDALKKLQDELTAGRAD